MTKQIKHWWAKISFWTKFRAICLGLGAGTEFALIISEDGHFYKWVVGGATFLALIIPIIFEDKDNNGEVDLFQNNLNGKK